MALVSELLKILQKQQAQAVGDSTPPLQSLLTVQPFNEPPNSFILAKSIDLPRGPRGDKNDLDTGFPPNPALTPSQQTRVNLGELQVSPSLTGNNSPVAVLELTARNEALVANQSDGTDLMDAFFTNNNPALTREFPVGSSISNRIRDSDGLATEQKGVDADIRDALREQFVDRIGNIDYRLMRGEATTGKPGVVLANPNGVKAPPEVGFDFPGEARLVALIGSFQACTLILKSFDVDKQKFTYRATLRYELIDHFGVDNSDVSFDGKGHGTAGQVAFWILQHKFHPGHIPYKIRVIVETEITGSLIGPEFFPPFPG